MTEKASKAERPPLPPDSVKIEVAAKLLGLTTARISQLVRSGHAISPARSYVRLPGLLSGYCRLLREQSDQGKREGAARQHVARAELIEAATARRREELIARVEAEGILCMIRDLATRHLRTLTSKRGAARSLPDVVRAKVTDEVEVALVAISDAHEAAVKSLRTGNFSLIEGGT